MMAKKKKKSVLEEEDRNVRKSLGPLKNGNHSERFQKFLKRYDLDLPRPKETGDIIQDIKNAIAWREQRAKYLEVIVDFYKSTYARGMQIFDELIDLEDMIMKRRKKLEEEGIDPLEDEALQKALDRKFKMMQYLDKIKFDKEKFYVEQKIKDMKQINDGNDKLFVVEADYDLEERFEEAEKKKKGDENEE